jgi:hypothetical protein
MVFSTDLESLSSSEKPLDKYRPTESSKVIPYSEGYISLIISLTEVILNNIITNTLSRSFVRS